MTTLITGATGKVGSRFARRMVDSGERVRLLVRDPAKVSISAETAVADLRDDSSVRAALDGVSAVVHIASSFRRWSDEELSTVDVSGTESLANLALDAGVSRFVYVSTNMVYDGCDYGRPATEDDPTGPALAGYPAAKVEAEKRLGILHDKHGLDLRVVRLAFVYGEGDPHVREAAGLFADLPPQRRVTTVHHADVAQALRRALTIDGLAGRTYNLADDAALTTYEILHTHGLTPEPPADTMAASLPDASPWAHTVDISRARAELGFRPLYPTVRTAADAGAL